ncbi:hypothetical protein [Paenibacillus hubeiensis]|uniref:hypothetical protein n=1 Tax=Paenibacillus hubeiensis TaxID=3077330 RepID=UPI0031BA8560
MSDAVLEQILNQLQQMNKRFDHIDQRLDNMDGRLDSMDGRFDHIEGRLDTIEQQTKDIPLLKQAVLETLEITKRLEENQASFERKVTAELNTHQHSIDILNRRQLRMEADIETLKNR